jgi:hypothetical protein
MTATIDVEDTLSKLDIAEKISLLAGIDNFLILLRHSMPLTYEC